MKKIILFLGLFIISFNSFTQIEPVNQEVLNKFLKTTTFAVKEDIGYVGYNVLIERSLESLWNLTPIKFMSLIEFRDREHSEDNSYLVLSEARYSTKDRVYKFNMLNLVLGGEAEYLPDMPEVVSIPFSFYKEVEDHYLYKIGAIIHLMHYYINFSKDNPDAKIGTVVKNYSAELKNLELWFTKEDLSQEVNTIEKVKQIYPYKVKLATKEEIRKAIEEKAEDVAIFYRLGPEGKVRGESKCWNFIIATKDGKPFYYASHKVNSEVPNALTAKDFKKLRKL